MALTLRSATQRDLLFLTEALHQTFVYLTECGDDPYSRGFDGITIEELEEYAFEYLDLHRSRTLILSDDGLDIGCIMGQLAPSHLTAAGIGIVGWIGLCYVNKEYQQSGNCALMYEAIQEWFASKSIRMIELSYMTANDTARETWRRLGFKPFREIAYKMIDKPRTPNDERWHLIRDDE